MKQCPRCNRDYADDALSFCLEDGTALIEKFDAQATLINPNPPIPVVPPTVAFKETPIAAPVYVARPGHVSAGVSAPRSGRSKWLVGALVVLALGVGLTIGGVIFQQANQPSSASDTPGPVRDPIATQSPTPATSKSSSPAASSSVAATPIPTPNVGQSNPKEPNCELVNDKSDQTKVNVRQDCDTKNCELDSSTLLTEYPNHTAIQVIRGSDVQTTRFTWVKVIIASSGRMVWVAKTKIQCLPVG